MENYPKNMFMNALQVWKRLSTLEWWTHTEFYQTLTKGLKDSFQNSLQFQAIKIPLHLQRQEPNKLLETCNKDKVNVFNGKQSLR